MVWLAGSAAVILLSLVLQIGKGRSVVLPVIGVALPETCALYSRFGIDCPGCGLTRSFIHVSDGNVSAAWHLNAVGVFLYAFVVFQIGLASYHLLATLRWLKLTAWAGWLTAVNQGILIALAVALFGQWLIGIVVRGSL
ncbi:MAG: hypothetical protein Aurels2KO_46430 [Aureliella sp.]